MGALRVLLVGLSLAACSSEAPQFDADDPSRGVADLIGQRDPLNASFTGGVSDDADPAGVTMPMGEEIPPCDALCREYCDDLGLDNPLDAGACKALWGIGLDTQAIRETEACRRLHADLLGRLPTRSEVRGRCRDGSWSDVVAGMLDDPEFVFVQRRHWADLLRYNNEAISIERIYDADAIVTMLYEGRLAYDEFAALMSAHPVLTRRYDTASDRAAALFDLFLGRPPYDNERSDMARLYTLWGNGYFDHPELGARLPDAVISYSCLTEDGEVDSGAKGQCTSVLWGYKELILTPDYRAVEGEMWSGFLTADEWHALQEPGRIIAEELGFWEQAVDRVLEQYLGYELAVQIPEARQALVEYLLRHNGDIRALHYAIATSQLYLQSTSGSAPTKHRHTYGPLKQIQVEPWIDSVKRTTGYSLSRCDHRMPEPDELLGEQASVASIALVDASDWDRNGEGDGIVRDYRDLARTLGGCPDNSVGGRFTTVSILTTAIQEGFVAKVCNPGLDPDEGAAVERLLPNGVGPQRALDPDTAELIVEAQVRKFFGREPTDTELSEARDNADACAPKPCTAEAFARPVCYALLSSSEMLFY